MPSTKSIVLVIAQFTVIGAILLTGPLLARHPVWLVVEVAGAGLAAWAVAAMRSSRLRVVPEVGAGSRLVTSGPYRMVRHPMYSSSLLALLGLVADHPTAWRIVLWIALLAVLAVKLRYEEQCLRAHFPEYEGYARRTSRLVPGLW